MSVHNLAYAGRWDSEKKSQDVTLLAVGKASHIIKLDVVWTIKHKSQQRIQAWILLLCRLACTRASPLECPQYSVACRFSNASGCFDTCPNNHIVTEQTDSACICNAGYTAQVPSGGGAKICFSCRHSNYKPMRGDNDYDCVDCEKGKYSTQHGAIAETECKRCPVNSYSPSGSREKHDCICNADYDMHNNVEWCKARGDLTTLQIDRAEAIEKERAKERERDRKRTRVHYSNVKKIDKGLFKRITTQNIRDYDASYSSVGVPPPIQVVDYRQDFFILLHLSTFYSHVHICQQTMR